MHVTFEGCREVRWPAAELFDCDGWEVGEVSCFDSLGEGIESVGEKSDL